MPFDFNPLSNNLEIVHRSLHHSSTDFTLTGSTTNLRSQASQSTFDCENPAGTNSFQISLGNTGSSQEVQMFTVSPVFRHWQTSDFAQGADHRSVYVQSDFDATDAHWIADTICVSGGVTKGRTFIDLRSDNATANVDFEALFEGTGCSFLISADSSANHIDVQAINPAGTLVSGHATVAGPTVARVVMSAGDFATIDWGLYVSTASIGAGALSADDRLYFTNITPQALWSVTSNGDMYSRRHIVASTGNISVRTTTSTATANFATSGTSRPGIQFVIASSTREPLWTTYDGAFGWEMFAENSANGDLFMRTNNSTNRYRFMRDTNRFEIGGTLSPTSGSGTLGSESLSINGLIHAAKGATFNSAGGSSSPDNFFRVFGNAGDAGTVYLYVNPSATNGGVGFFTTQVTGGILNYASGALDKDKTGAAGVGYAGTGIDCSASRVHLIDWYGESGAYDSTAASVYGFGHQVDNATTGDMAIIRKDGEVGTGLIVQYIERSTGFVGFGSGFTFAGTDPDSQVHVGGTFHVDSTSQMGGDITLDDGVDFIINTTNGSKIGTGNTQKIGFWNATPVVRPSAYTQTYSTSTKTHANLTSATLTDSSGGTANTTVQALTDPADTPADADTLRDDLVATLIPELRNNFADLAAQCNALRVDIENVKQVLNAVIDDDQTIGIKG